MRQIRERLAIPALILALSVPFLIGQAGKIPKLAQYSVPDPYLQCPAWTFIAPADWVKEGGVVWTGSSRPSMYYTTLSVRNPSGPEEFRLFPIFLFIDTANPLLANGVEMRPYVDNVASVIREVLIPRCRPEVGQFRIVRSESLPAIASEAVARARAVGVIGAQARAVRMLVEYAASGRPIEEMFYCTIVAGSAGGVVTWTVDRAFSYRSEKGKLKADMPLFGTIAASLQENPRWVAARRQELQRIVASRSRPPATSAGTRGPSILDVSKQMSRDNDSFLSGVDASFSARLNSPGLDAWHNAQMGTNPMVNPTTNERIDVSNGYLRYFQDNLGRGYGSNDVIGDPYVNYGINATELTPAGR
jgi:hypothetical protein